MSYTAEISRNNPTCFLFLIDQSGSMDEQLGGQYSNMKKADAVADAMNKLLQNLALKCAKAEGIRDYFHVGVIGYGVGVGPAFVGPHQGKELVPISEIGTMPSRVEDRPQKIPDGAGGLVEQTVKFPTWFDPVADGGTPMCQALRRANQIISTWLNNHPDCHPPIIINISDGQPTDGDPTLDAESLKNLSSSDGNALLLNLHLSSQDSQPIEFPDSEEILPDQHARLLFNMSSILPEKMQVEAQNEGFNVSDRSRGFIFNSDIVKVIQFLDIGTRATNLR